MHGGSIPDLLTAKIIPAVVLTYGEEHSNQDPTAIRARWDPAEIDVLREITTRLIESNPERHGLLMHLALKEIRANSEYRKVFHIRHVADSARLRGGYIQHIVNVDNEHGK